MKSLTRGESGRQIPNYRNICSLPSQTLFEEQFGIIRDRYITSLDWTSQNSLESFRHPDVRHTYLTRYDSDIYKSPESETNNICVDYSKLQEETG